MLNSVICWTRTKKWQWWISLLPFVLLPLLGIFHGEIWGAVAVLAFLGAFYAGGLIGYLLGKSFSRFINASAQFGQRFSAAASGFGIFFLPPLLAAWANTYLGTDIWVASLWLHFFWACVCGAIFFWTKDE